MDENFFPSKKFFLLSNSFKNFNDIVGGIKKKLIYGSKNVKKNSPPPLKKCLKNGIVSSNLH